MKSVFIDKMTEVVGSKKAAEAAYRALLAEITESLAAGHNVTMHGIGKFSVVTRAARKGRNPRTGEGMEIPTKNAVVFKAAKRMKMAVNGGGK